MVAAVGALLITIGTNFCNDYADYASGADTINRKGPTRVTQAGLLSPRQVKVATFIVFALVTVLGVYLIYRAGWVVLLIGFSSIFAGIFYTAGPWPYGYKGLGELFVILFFGPVAVGGTYYVQTLEITSEVLILGFAPGLLGAAILIVNNIRDIEEDRQANKLTLMVRFGRRFGIGLWTTFVGIAVFLPLGYTRTSGAHSWAGLTIFLLIPALWMLRGLIATRDPIRLNPFLGKTALLLLVHSLIFATGWVLG